MARLKERVEDLERGNLIHVKWGLGYCEEPFTVRDILVALFNHLGLAADYTPAGDKTSRLKIVKVEEKEKDE